MRNVECGIALEVRSLHDAHLDIPHSALRIPHSRGSGGGNGPDNRRRVQGSSFKDASGGRGPAHRRSEEHTSELQSQSNLVCRLLLEKKKYGSVSVARQPRSSWGLSP